MSGIVGIVGGQDHAARIAVSCLHGVQHFGRRHAQLAVLAGEEIITRGGDGLVASVFAEEHLGGLLGRIAIGQVSQSRSDQPERDGHMFVAGSSALGTFAVAFHGAFVNRDALLAELRETTPFQSHPRRVSDAELFAHLLAAASGSLDDRLVVACGRVRGAYTILLLLPREQAVVAIRDPRGFHALYHADLPASGGVVLSSERTSFPLVEAHHAQAVRPGFATIFRCEDGKVEMRRVSLFQQEKASAACAHRASFIPLNTATDSEFGSIYRVRYAFGEALAQDDHVEVDFVAAIPMSGIVAGAGYAAARGLPYHPAIQRNPFGDGHIPEPKVGGKVRMFGTKIELGVAPGIIKGRRLVVVDDSLLQGGTALHVIRLLRIAGASEVHLRIAAPPIVRTCPYGVPTPPTEQMLVVRLPDGLADPNVCAAAVEADSVRFLDATAFRRVIMLTGRTTSVCDYCYGGGPNPDQV